jgi:serine/threonine-protein kinase
MPPEQLRGEKVDRRADVYAAGVVLWEGLSGQSLWGDLGNAQIATRLAHADVPSLHEIAPAVPKELRDICARALDVRPQNRYATAAEFRAELVSYAGRNNMVASRTEVAECVERLFAEERERIDRIIQAQLPQASGQPIVMADLVPLRMPDDYAEGARTPPNARGFAPTQVLSPAGKVPAPGRSLTSGRTPTPSRAQTPGGAQTPAGGRTLGRGGFAPLSAGSTGGPPGLRRWFPAVVAVGFLVALSLYGVSRLSGPPASLPPPVTVPPAEAPPARAYPQILELTLPEESPAAAPAPAEEGAPPATPPRRTSASRSGSGRPARAPSAASSPAPAEAPPAGKADSLRRWNGRILDLDNPYGGEGPVPAVTKPTKHTIDRSNPWPLGETK